MLSEYSATVRVFPVPNAVAFPHYGFCDGVKIHFKRVAASVSESAAESEGLTLVETAKSSSDQETVGRARQS